MSSKINCPECGTTLDSRGLHGHMMWKHPNADVEDVPEQDNGGDDSNSENVLDITENEETGASQTPPNCPECGGDDIGEGSDVVDQMIQKGYSKEAVHQVRLHKWVCGDCLLAFDEGEA